MPAMSASQTMGPRRTWFISFVLGATVGAAVLLAGVVGLGLTAAALGLIVWKGPRVIGLAGFICGFGAGWAALLLNAMARCSVANAQPGAACGAGDTGAYVAVAIVAVLVGVTATGLRALNPGPAGPGEAPPGPATRGRRLGAIVGLVGALAIDGLAAVFDQVSGGNPILSTVAVPVLIAGWVSGWLLGPRAIAARTRRDWAWTVVWLAAWAVLIGTLVVVLTMWVTSTSTSGEDPLLYLIASAPLALVTLGFGILVAGPFALVFTLSASLLWAGLMSRLRTNEPSQVSGSGTHSPSAAPTATNSG